MIKEIDILGVFVPPLFAYAAIAGVIWLALRRLIAAAALDRFVWHPSLFNTALYVLVLSGLVILTFG